MKIKEAVKKVADTTTSNIPSRSNVWSHVSSRLSSPHVSSSQSGNLTCIYCNGFHWQILQSETCKVNARKEPWL
ncbi:hypothetical protein GLOIN_2v1662649 [Rhizophagus irregularis DAOM 181602=DAOM 197198]|nr:hypothetical protein GLOIN_2v1662649 [Rhizophagus irregularis DAOM 181602=DAOM 197198]